MNVFEMASGLSIIGGAVGGAVLGFQQFGFLGAVVGVPVGAVLGWAAIFAGPMLLLVGALAIGVWIRDGGAEARRFLWGRGHEPPDANSLG